MVALRKLDQIEAAIVLDDLRIPPGNRLEPLRGDREGQHSVRINDRWRICFVWKDDGPHDVEIVAITSCMRVLARSAEHDD